MHVDTFSDATPFPAAGASQEVELVKELQQPFVDVEGIYNNAKEVEVKFNGPFAPNYSVSPEVAKEYKDTITQDKGYVDGSQQLMDKFNLNEEQAKGIKEQADLERILTVTNAKHIESVKSQTGLKFNFYEARQPDLGDPQYKMQIDPRAVEVITQTVLASLTSTEQTYLTPDQVRMVTELAQNGGLDSISISVVATGNLQACLLKMMY